MIGTQRLPLKSRSDYSTVTETPGTRVTSEAFKMLHSRYAYAAEFCQGKDVLEVACGAGQGLGYLARRTRHIVGGDYTHALLDLAHQHYRGRVPLVCLDAHSLPFRDQSFEVVLLFEAIYYLADPENFLQECRRVMRPTGVLLVCSANKEWYGFNPSPFSKRYFSAGELKWLLDSSGFNPQIYGAFPAAESTGSRRVIASVRKLAVRWNLIPKTMKGKEALKRLFYGQLVALGPEIDEHLAQPAPLYPISTTEAVTGYKILYVIGRLKESGRVSQSHCATGSAPAMA